jgi:predicted restriction endonuclease
MVGDLVARAMRALRDAFRPSGVGSGFVADLKAAGLPGATEIERLVVQRVGQDVFRAGLLEYWDGRRAVTGLAVPELLRASHIKPWADCATDAERLDVFNGLLLAPHLDAAFDRGFITVGDDGAVLVSASLRREDAKLIGMDTPLGVKALADAHRRYLAWHRSHLFKSASEAT